jgi:hypothetical protein
MYIYQDFYAFLFISQPSWRNESTRFSFQVMALLAKNQNKKVSKEIFFSHKK